MSNDSQPPPVLECRGPARPAAKWTARDALAPLFAVFVAALAFLFGLFGLFMFGEGLLGIAYFTRRTPPSRDLPAIVFELAMFVVIGLFCLFVAVRWCRAIRRVWTHR